MSAHGGKHHCARLEFGDFRESSPKFLVWATHFTRAYGGSGGGGSIWLTLRY